MQKYKYQLLFIICAVATTFLGCEKDEKDLIDQNNKWVYIDSANSSFVKFYQVFAGNTPQLPTAANATTGPQVFIYANGNKITGNTIGYGGVFPATNVYAALPAGTTKFEIINGRLDLSVVPNLPKFIAGDTLATFTTTLDKNKYYSIFIGDSVPFVRATIKEDMFATPDVGTYKIRIANMFMNNNPTDTVSLFSVRQNAEIITNITHKEVSDWVQIPIPIISDTLRFIKKGTTTTYAQLTGFSPTPLRSYTLVGRGKNGVTAKTPAAALITNR